MRDGTDYQYLEKKGRSVVAATKEKVSFKPAKDYLLVKEVPPGETLGGIAIPEGAEVGPPKFIVIAAGPGKWSDIDPEKRFPMDAKAGDVVYVKGGQMDPLIEFPMGGEDYYLVRDRNVLGWG